MLSDDDRNEVLDLIEGAKGEMLHEFIAVKRNQATLKGDIAQAHHDVNLVHDDVQFLREQMREGFAHLTTSMRSLIDDNRATRVEVDLLGNRVGRLEVRMDGLETRLTGIEAKVDGLGATMEVFGTRLTGIEAKVDGLGATMEVFGTRLTGLEGAVGLLVERLDRFLPPES